MMFLFLPLALCEALPVFQSYSIDAFINQAGSHPAYILCLFKEPKNLNDTSAVFRRLITSIPVEMDPRLAILIDPSLQRRHLLYVSENKVRVTVNISFAKMQTQYAKSNRAGVNFGVRTRFHALIDIVNGELPVSKEKREPFSNERKETEVWKEKYHENGFSERDLDTEVVEIITEKNEERAVIVKEALKIQEEIEALLAAKGEKRRELPSFDQVDPRKRGKDDEDLPDPQVDDEDDMALDADSADVDLEDDDEAPIDARKMKPQGDDDEDDGDEEEGGVLRRTVEKVKKIWKTATGDTTEENGKGKTKRKAKTDKGTEKESKAKKDQVTEKDSNKEKKAKKDEETVKASKKEKSEAETGKDSKTSTGKKEEETEKDRKKEEETKTEERTGTDKDGKKEQETKTEEKTEKEKGQDEKAAGEVKKEEGSTKSESSDAEKKEEEKTQSEKEEIPDERKRQSVKENTEKEEETTRKIPAWRRRMEEEKKDEKTGSGVEKESKDTQQEDVPIPAWWKRKQEEESKKEAESSTTKMSTEESHSIPAWRRRMEEAEKKTDNAQAESVTEQAPTSGWGNKKQDEEGAKDKAVSSHDDVPSTRRTREDSLETTTTKTTRKTHRPVIGDTSEESQGSDWKDSVLQNVEKKLREKNLLKS